MTGVQTCALPILWNYRIKSGRTNVTDHVLKDFDEEEKIKLENITNNITDSLSILLDKKLELFSSTINNK